MPSLGGTVMAAAGNSHWSSRFAFLMASVGFAVGLGNIWRFPYVTGENGGAAFVLVYLACAVGIGVPILMAELLIGRRGQGSPTTAMSNLARQNNSSQAWRIVGGMGLLAAYTIEIVYAVVVGWVLWYLFKAVTTGFVGVDAVAAKDQFDAVLGDNLGMLFWTLMALAITGMIIYSGIKDGIERAVNVMMPLMFLLLVFLAGYNYYAGGFDEAVEWLFTYDSSKISGATMLAAVGQAFFSLGVGMAGMMVYGSYLPRNISITSSVFVIVLIDTGVALLAGLVIFPAVFNNGLDPAVGAGLIFQTLPVAFAQMPGGYLFSILFFVMLSVAGITSMVGLAESVNAWLEDRFNVPRKKSAILVVGSVAVFSVFSILTYNVMGDWGIGGWNFNSTLEYFSNQVLLPLGGLLIAVFAGWAMTRESTRDELNAIGDIAYSIWYFLIRFVVPPTLLIIFVMGVSDV